jgi:hypothetical protein
MATWAKIGIVLSAGLAVAFVVRAVVPSDLGLALHYGNVARGVPLYRVAFWLCLVLTLFVALRVARIGKSA